MIVAVIGSRNFADYALVEATLSALPKLSQVVSGGAKGADSLAQRYAEQHQIPLLVFKPDWSQFGRGAGVVRNRQIVEAAEHLIAFWDGVSKGTASSIKLARAKGVPVQVIAIPAKSA